MNVSPDAWTTTISGVENDYRAASTPGFTVATTVNGITFQMSTITALYSNAFNINSGSHRELPYFDSVGANLFGYTETGDIVQASNVISGSNGMESGIQYAFLPTNRFNESFSRVVDPSTWNMEALRWATPTDEHHAQNKVRFDSESISRLLVSVSDVPEPSSIALVGVALAGLVFVRHRRI